MQKVWQKLHRVGDFLRLPDLPGWLVGLLALMLVLRIPSFFEPFSYGDEMIYLSLGQGVRQEMTLYKDVHDNKPPLLYWTAALAGNLFWFKAILAFWSLATIVVFYKLSEILFKKSGKGVVVSTVIFALLTTIPLIEGNIVNSELFMIGLSMASLFILLSQNLNPKRIYLAGILFGLATLFKVPAMFDAPIIIAYWFIVRGLKDWRKILADGVVLLSGFLTPIVFSFIWFFASGALSEYLAAAFMQNVGYISSFRPGDVQKSFILRNAPLLIRALIVVLGSGILFLFKKKLSKEFILLCLWTLFGLFAVTLSERPYPHYLIQIAAPVSMLFSILLIRNTLEQGLVIFPLALTFFVPVFYKFYIYPVSGYYLHFAKFAAQKITREEYFKGFGKYVNRNYEIAGFLTKSGRTQDRVFMWDSDSPSVYALSRRLPPIKYVADYHINDYSSKDKVAGELESDPPKFIILTSDKSFDQLIPLIRSRYILLQEIENAQIYSRLDFDR